MWISNGDTTAALAVYTYSQMHVYERRLIEIRGNHGISWQEASVCLPEGTYQLAFVATHGLQFLSDIAVDEIDLYYEEPNECLMYHDEYDDDEYDGEYFELRETSHSYDIPLTKPSHRSYPQSKVINTV